MFSVQIGNDLLEKLRHLLEDEDDGTCIRLREYKLGAV